MAIPASDYIDLSSLAELRDLLDTEMLQGLITEFIQDTEAGTANGGARHVVRD